MSSLRYREIGISVYTSLSTTPKSRLPREPRQPERLQAHREPLRIDGLTAIVLLSGWPGVQGLHPWPDAGA